MTLGKTYYVVLWKDCLSYFDAESKSTARGFISTESIISLKCEEFKFPSNTSKLDQKQKDKIEEEKKKEEQEDLNLLHHLEHINTKQNTRKQWWIGCWQFKMYHQVYRK